MSENDIEFNLAEPFKTLCSNEMVAAAQQRVASRNASAHKERSSQVNPTGIVLKSEINVPTPISAGNGADRCFLGHGFERDRFGGAKGIRTPASDCGNAV